MKLLNRFKEITLLHDLKDKRIRILLILLILIDLVFVVLHILHAFRVLYNMNLSLEQDMGYAEIYQYIKEFFIVVFFVIILFKTKEIGYISWAFIFLFLLLDDALQLHECMGKYIADYFHLLPSFGLRAVDLGELAYAGIFGIILITALIVFYYFGSKSFRKISINIFILIIMLLFFGVVVDMIHIIVDKGYRVRQLIGTIEDAGEMIVMSFMLGYVYLESINYRRA